MHCNLLMYLKLNTLNVCKSSTSKASEVMRKMFVSVSLYSQYTSLWSVSNSPLTPVSQNGGANNGLSSQYLRGSGSHYPSLSHSVAVPSSGSPMYDSGTATELHDAAQYDTSPHGRLPSAWTPVTPPSLWWKRPCKIVERQSWNVVLRMFNLLWLKGRINPKFNLHNPIIFLFTFTANKNKRDFELTNLLKNVLWFQQIL